MTYLIDNILFISTLLVLLIQLSYWVFDKIKIKKNIEELEDSLIKLRKTNHEINNKISVLNIKLENHENTNKTD